MKRFLFLLSSIVIAISASSCSCNRCIKFNKYVHSFQKQMNKSNIQQQKELIFTMFYDHGDYNCHYTKSITSWKKRADVYVVELSFYCCCEHSFCFHENKNSEPLSITVNIKGQDNFYSLYAE